MANREFLARLDREIASLKDRIESRKDLVPERHPPGKQSLEPDILQEAIARLKHLEEMREKVIAQSFGN